VADLSKLAGLPVSTVRPILNGERIASVGTVAQLERALRADLYPTGMYWRLDDRGER
jgi:transcriptional regulator with XRE-family HTH domain